MIFLLKNTNPLEAYAGLGLRGAILHILIGTAALVCLSRYSIPKFYSYYIGLPVLSPFGAGLQCLPASPAADTGTKDVGCHARFLFQERCEGPGP